MEKCPNPQHITQEIRSAKRHDIPPNKTEKKEEKLEAGDKDVRSAN